MGLFGPPNIEKMKEKRDIQGLIKALEYEKDKAVRMNAANALGELGDHRAIEALVVILDDADPGVRGTAIEALGALGEDACVKPLVAQLRDPRPDIRQIAGMVLARLGVPAVKPLLELLKDNKDDIRRAAVEVIVAIGPPAVDILSTFLRNTDRLKGSLVAEALGRIGDRRARPALEAALKNPIKEIRFSAALALGRLGDTDAIQGLLAALEDKELSVRNGVTEALQKLGWTPGQDACAARQLILQQEWEQCAALGAVAVEPLIQFIRSEPDTIAVSIKAIDALEKIRDPDAIPLLIDALGDGNKDVRRAAAVALGAMGAKQAVEPLAYLLGDTVSRVGMAGAAALVEIGGVSVQQTLVAMLEDSNENRRVHAANVLKKLGWKPTSQDAEVQFLISTEDWDGCIKLGKPAVVALVALLQEKHASASVSAAITLGRIGDPAAVDALAAALADKRPAVSQAAEDALVMFGSPAIRPVQDMLRCSQRVLREQAARLLDRLGWQPQTSEEKAWYWCSKRWWKECKALKAAAVEPLMLILDDKDKELRLAAIETLGVIADSRAVEPLICTLSDQYIDIQVASVRALGSIGDPAAVDGILKAFGDFSHLERVVSVDKAWELQLAVVHALRDIGDEHAAQGLLTLIRDGKNQGGSLIDAAGAALVGIGWKAHTQEEQVWFLISTKKWDELIVLGEGAVDTLRVALKSYWRIPGCGQAVEALATISAAGTVELLIQYLTLQAFEMRQAAARSLVRLYQAGEISPAEKQVILEQRDFIEKPHGDSSHVDFPETCTFAPHIDNGGAGVKFPL